MNVYACSSCGWSFDHEINAASGLQACPHCGWKDELTVTTTTATPQSQTLKTIKTVGVVSLDVDTPETVALIKRISHLSPDERRFAYLDAHKALERRLLEAEAENKRILELHKGLMAEADSRLEAAERRAQREVMIQPGCEILCGTCRLPPIMVNVEHCDSGAACPLRYMLFAAPKDDNEAA